MKDMKKGTLYGVLYGVTWAVNALLLYNVLNLYVASRGDTTSFTGWMLNGMQKDEEQWDLTELLVTEEDGKGETALTGHSSLRLHPS